MLMTRFISIQSEPQMSMTQVISGHSPKTSKADERQQTCQQNLPTIESRLLSIHLKKIETALSFVTILTSGIRSGRLELPKATIDDEITLRPH
jgi:hypothetical protein